MEQMNFWVAFNDLEGLLKKIISGHEEIEKKVVSIISLRIIREAIHNLWPLKKKTCFGFQHLVWQKAFPVWKWYQCQFCFILFAQEHNLSVTNVRLCALPTGNHDLTHGEFLRMKSEPWIKSETQRLSLSLPPNPFLLLHSPWKPPERVGEREEWMKMRATLSLYHLRSWIRRAENEVSEWHARY